MLNDQAGGTRRTGAEEFVSRRGNAPLRAARGVGVESCDKSGIASVGISYAITACLPTKAVKAISKFGSILQGGFCRSTQLFEILECRGSS
jgi:hypothetical protein